MSLNEAEKMKARLPRGLNLAQAQARAQKARRVVIARTLWYPDVIDALEKSARDYLVGLGIRAEAIRVVDVPGSFELPLGIQQQIDQGGTDFVVALGCIIRGDTPHFDFVSRAAVDGLMRVSLDRKIPVGLGVLTVDSLEQARVRLDKGAEAAQAACFLWLQAPGAEA